MVNVVSKCQFTVKNNPKVFYCILFYYCVVYVNFDFILSFLLLWDISIVRDLFSLNISLLFVAHSIIFFISMFMQFSASTTVFPLVSIIRSSAKAIACEWFVNSNSNKELYSTFQKPGPQHEPCGQPFVILLVSLTLFIVSTTVLLLKYPLLRLYRFHGQLNSFKPCRMLVQEAVSKAPLTSRLVLWPPLFSPVPVLWTFLPP